MRNVFFLLISLTLFTSCKTSQNTLKPPEAKLQSITLEDIWRDYTFYPHYMQSLKKMKGGFYTVLEKDAKQGKMINIYRFKDLQKIETVISEQETHFKIDDYTFSEDGNKILIATGTEPIFRHSKRSHYYVFDRESGDLQQVFDKKIQSPAFSPAADKLAYVYDNDLYYKDLNTGKIHRITNDGKHNYIINGLTDWVYEEEFGFVRAYHWNSDGSALAFLRFDESGVPLYNMNIYGTSLYPEVTTFKYPKAGESNSKVTLHVYNLKEQRIKQVALPAYEYLPRLTWTQHPDTLAVQCMNRLQNHLTLYKISRKDLQYKAVYEEESDTYINVRDMLTFLDDGSFIMSNETSGYQHLYLYDAAGHLLNPITKGNWEVTDYYGYDQATGTIYYRSTEDGSTVRTLYVIHADGSGKKRISSNRGINKPFFSDDKQYFILNYQDAQSPPVYTLHTDDGKLIKEVINNDKLKKLLGSYSISTREFSTLHTSNGDFNMWMIKPRDFNPDRQYPLLMYQYSGPGVQTVMDRWNGFDTYWYYMLADKGYIIVSVDGRGTGGRGAEFTHCTYGQLGKYETLDQIAAAKALGALPYIDKDRIGIWGWSFGGFTTANALFKGNDVFRMGIAVAPVTSWRYYDTVYTERYMGLPDDNPSGYDENSPLFFAAQLKGKFLLIHGSGDDNVHVQNTMQLINAMIKADVPYDSEIYPDRTHGIYRGENTRLHLYKKMTDFILKNL